MRIHSSARLIVGSIAVYLSVATLHACRTDSPNMLTSGTGGSSGATGTEQVASAASGKSVSAGAVMNPVPDADAEESGSRLKAQWRVGEDGARQFAGWWDSERAEACFFLAAADGTERCLPAFGAASIIAAITSFSDATCTSGVALRSTTCPSSAPKTIASPGVGDVCSGHYAIFAVGQKFVGSTLFSITGGSCKAYPVPVGYEGFAVGPEIPPSAFVASTITTDP